MTPNRPHFDLSFRPISSDHRTVFAPVRTVRRVRRFQKDELFALFVVRTVRIIRTVRTVRYFRKKMLTEQCEQANMFVRSSVVPAYK